MKEIPEEGRYSTKVEIEDKIARHVVKYALLAGLWLLSLVGSLFVAVWIGLLIGIAIWAVKWVMAL